MADLPLPQIREKKFQQQEIDLCQFTDEELYSRYRFGRVSIQYLVEILKNDLERQTRRKHKQLPTWLLLHVINLVIIKQGFWTVDCGLNIRYKDYIVKTWPIISRKMKNFSFLFFSFGSTQTTSFIAIFIYFPLA